MTAILLALLGTVGIGPLLFNAIADDSRDEGDDARDDAETIRGDGVILAFDGNDFVRVGKAMT